MREACDLILAGLDRLAEAVAARAQEHRRTPMIGRTHGVHAEPTTFGLKPLGWVFELDRAGIKAIATEGARMVKEHAAKHPDTEWTFEYSPESFTGTELDYAVEVCNAVIEIWQPTPARRLVGRRSAHERGRGIRR